MAYNSSNLSALTYANGFTLWHYKTNDTAAVVDTAGYFNNAAGDVARRRLHLRQRRHRRGRAVGRVHRQLQRRAAWSTSRTSPGSATTDID